MKNIVEFLVNKPIKNSHNGKTVKLDKFLAHLWFGGLISPAYKNMSYEQIVNGDIDNAGWKILYEEPINLRRYNKDKKIKDAIVNYENTIKDPDTFKNLCMNNLNKDITVKYISDIFEVGHKNTSTQKRYCIGIIDGKEIPFQTVNVFYKELNLL